MNYFMTYFMAMPTARFISLLISSISFSIAPLLSGISTIIGATPRLFALISLILPLTFSASRSVIMIIEHSFASFQVFVRDFHASQRSRLLSR